MRLTDGLPGNIRYSLRQFRQAPMFTAAAVFTLALGIGGTTAIFTLIDAVMLKSLPVPNPTALWRIGDGDDCCVQSGPQDRWGFFSYPLYQRLKAIHAGGRPAVGGARGGTQSSRLAVDLRRRSRRSWFESDCGRACICGGRRGGARIFWRD